MLIYLAIVILRAFSPDGVAERRFAAWGRNHPVMLRTRQEALARGLVNGSDDLEPCDTPTLYG